VVPKSLWVHIGDSIQFVCYSQWNVTWELDRNPVPSNVLTHHVQGSAVYWISIPYVEMFNEGTYKCLATENKEHYGNGKLRVISEITKQNEN